MGGEIAAQAFDRASQTFARGLFGDAEEGADFLEFAALEKTEQDDFAIGGAQIGECLVEHGHHPLDQLLVGIGIGDHLNLRLGGQAFVALSAKLAAANVGGAVASGIEEPAGKTRGRNTVGFFGENNEDGLGDILGSGGVAGLAQCGGIDEIDVALDDLAQRFGGAVLDVIGEKLAVVSHEGHLFISVRSRDSGTGERAWLLKVTTPGLRGVIRKRVYRGI